MNRWKLARYGCLAMSVIICFGGLYCLLYPVIPPNRMCIWSGIILTIYGIIKIVGYYSDDMYCLAFQYDLACGILLIVLGILTLINHLYSMDITPYLSPGLGLLVLMDGLLTIQTSRDAKRFGLDTWYVILVASLIASVFGGIVLIRAFQPSNPSAFFTGFALLAQGIKTLCIVLSTVKRMETFHEETPDTTTTLHDATERSPFHADYD